jgi:DNA polymerase V
MSSVSPVPVSLLSHRVVELEGHVRAGFPSPAEDLGAKRVDVLEELLIHPQASYWLSVRGDSMAQFGIWDRDTLLVDRAIRPAHGHIVVAVLDNEFVCKYLYKRGGVLKLKAGNPTYPDIVPNRDGQTLEIWGVVLTAFKRFKV